MILQLIPIPIILILSSPPDLSCRPTFLSHNSQSNSLFFISAYGLILKLCLFVFNSLNSRTENSMVTTIGIDDCMKMLCSQDKDGAKCGEALGKVIRMNNSE